MDGIEYLIDILEGVDSYMNDPLKAERKAADYVIAKCENSAREELHKRVKRALAEYRRGEVK